MVNGPDEARFAVSDQADRRTLLLTIGLVVGVIIFTTLLFGIALLNSVIGLREEQTATSSHIAATASERGQTVLSLLWEAAGAPPAERGDIGTRLADVAPQVPSTLDALRSGGTVGDLDGNRLRVLPLAGDELRTIVRSAANDWQQIAPVTADVIAGRRLDRARVAAVVPIATSISRDFDRLEHAIAADGQSQNNAASTLRTILTTLAVFIFLFIVSSLLGRVRQSQVRLTDFASDLGRRNDDLQAASRDLAQAKAGTDTIMETVNQGLFLITPDFKIAGQYSRELETIFRMPSLEGANILNLLQRLLTERMFNTSKRYMTLLFDKTKKQRTLLQVNPLAQIEVSFPNPEGGYSLRYLSFAFRRIIDDKEIARVFVAVNDVTQRVELETELRLSEARKNRQFELLLSVLYVEPRQIDEFIALAQDQLGQINTALRTQDFVATNGQMANLRSRLEAVFRCVHTIKGNAQMMNLPYFVTACQQFEATIVLLRNRSALGGDDFLTIAVEQSNLSKDVAELQEVRQRFVGMKSLATALPVAERAPGDEMLDAIVELAKSIAAVSGKVVDVELVNFDTGVLDQERRRALRDMLIQLVRNSVVHGVELPVDRELLGKPARATITITGNADRSDAADTFAFSFRDDGRGLDPERIKASAVAAGIISSDEAARLAAGPAVGLIFRPGFSTASSVTVDAGRGVGMDVIRDLVIDRLGGTISMKSTPSRFTEFSFTIPLAPAPATDAALVGGGP